MEEENISTESEKESFLSGGLFSYKNDEKQTVFKIFGIEMTAPKGLKKPGIVYMAFIIVNMIIFFILKSFVVS
mgnify:CR=1 FL=1